MRPTEHLVVNSLVRGLGAADKFINERETCASTLGKIMRKGEGRGDNRPKGKTRARKEAMEGERERDAEENRRRLGCPWWGPLTRSEQGKASTLDPGLWVLFQSVKCKEAFWP